MLWTGRYTQMAIVQCTVAGGAVEYLPHIIRFYHLLYAVAYKVTIISFPQHPT